MIVLYDYEGSTNEERARTVHTSVKDLSDQVVAKILMKLLEVPIEEATDMVSKGGRDKDNFWWSEDRQYSVEVKDG